MDTVKNVKENFYILLFNEEGCLLNARYRPGAYEKKHEYKAFFTQGVFFSEESIGTNAVSIAK